MIKTLKISVLSVVVFHTNWLHAQTFSNKGKEFWVGYGHHQFMETTNLQEMVLYFSAEQTAQVTVTINGTAYREVYTVPAGSVVPSKLMPKGFESTPASLIDSRLYTRPVTYPGGTGSEGVFKNKAIHIESDVPIVVYAHIYGDLSSGATMLMPVETWGYSYISVNTPQFYSSSYGSSTNCFSWLYVVAKENNTRVRIVPTVKTRKGDPAGVSITVDLQKGEIYQLLGAPINAEAGYNVAGSTITSVANNQGQCYPVAVFSGSSRTQVTCLDGVGSGDNIMQQVFPLQAWGKRYLTAPTSVDNAPKSHNINVFRIVVKDPATIVKKNGLQLLALNRSNGYYYEYQSNTADYIEADKPILVAQYIPSANSCGYVGNGDPEMILLSPMEQSIKRIGFYRNNKESIQVNYLSLIIPDGGLNSLTIDGVAGGFSDVYPHPNFLGYSVVVKRWAAAQAQCIVQSDSAFTSITYGLGGAESYGYNAGTYINNLNGFPAINNQYNPGTQDNKYTCVKTPVQLSVLMRYQPTVLRWQLSALTGVVTPSTDVVQNNPVSSGTTTINGLTYYRYSLLGYYVFSQQGTHTIPLLATSPSVENCSQTEEVQYQVEVKQGFSTDFDIQFNNCSLSENVQFTGSDLFSNNDTVKNWQWNLPGTTTVAGKNVSQVFAAGTYPVRLLAIDSVGCLADTTKSFTLAASPKIPDFNVISSDRCIGSSLKFADVEPETGVKNSWWDFGNNDTSTVNASAPVVRQFAQYGIVTVKHVAKFSETCVSDTVVKTVQIYAKPTIDIENPSACLTKGGIVVFNNKSTVVDGQSISLHQWNFGDVTAGSGNPNTSSVVNASHSYKAAGDYTVTYKATSQQGCVVDTSLLVTLNALPQLKYASIPSVCINAGVISVAFASELSAANGQGSYSGIATSAAGAFDPSIAGVGTHRLAYTFTTSNGCTDTVLQSIIVKPSPVASFNLTDHVCKDSSVLFQQQSFIGNGTISSWHWSFGDGTSSIKTVGQNFSRAYPKNGIYSVGLFVEASNGCVSDTVVNTMQVHSLPVASFTLPAHVCMPSGEAKFTNTSTVEDGSSLTYNWDFGDNIVSAEKNPLHVYQSSGNYQVKLVVSSAAGCTAISTSLLDKFYDQPKALFASSASDLCDGQSVVFTDQSIASNSNIAGWNWLFGDGSNSNKKDASKTYSKAGTYTVKLAVSSVEGCLSDTASGTINVHIQPVIDAGPSVVVKEGTVVQFAARANASSLSFSWSPANELDNPSALQPKLIVTHDAVYTLTASSEHNCVATDELKVTVQKQVTIPNAFSPNGDGINDVWLIKNIQQYPAATIEIYDRYGKLVMRGNGASSAWAGTRNGQPLPVGVYYYAINLKDGTQVQTGSVTIIR